MANQKCPYCGSYDTSIAYLNYAGKAAKVTAKILGSIAAAVLAGPSAGAHVGHRFMEMEKEKKEEERKVKGHLCNKCGKEW